jgi:hypothetical protein
MNRILPKRAKSTYEQVGGGWAGWAILVFTCVGVVRYFSLLSGIGRFTAIQEAFGLHDIHDGVIGQCFGTSMYLPSVSTAGEIDHSRLPIVRTLSQLSRRTGSHAMQLSVMASLIAFRIHSYSASSFASADIRFPLSLLQLLAQFHPFSLLRFCSMEDRQDTQTLLARSSLDSKDIDWDKELSTSSYYGKYLIQSLAKRVISCVQQWLYYSTVRPLGIRRSTFTPIKKRIIITIFNAIVAIVLLLILASILDAIAHPSYAKPPPHYHTLERNVRIESRLGRGNPRNEKIFIAANIIQADMIKGPWGSSLITLVGLLGPENVFVSIYENDSGSASSEALRHLGAQLPCKFPFHLLRDLSNTCSPGRHSIITGAHLPLSGFPSVALPNGRHGVKRLTYLSHIRNLLLRPLEEPPIPFFDEQLQANYTDTRFNRILFLNDVYYNPIDALHLLFSTNQNPLSRRADYDVACAIDFVSSVIIYDTFVMRDTEGYGTGLVFFPWFTSKGEATSRIDVLAERDAVRVRSCWGGMAAFDAAPFLRQHSGAAPLRFRHQSELYWEASECCLIGADVAARKPGAKIFVNPYVRVAYDDKTWSWLPFVRRIERVFKILQYIVSAVAYPVEHNPRRLELPGDVSTQWRWVYDNETLNGEAFRDQRLGVRKEDLGGSWRRTQEVAEAGGFCGQRKLFVMKENLRQVNQQITGTGRNWENRKVPAAGRWRR